MVKRLDKNCAIEVGRQQAPHTVQGELQGRVKKNLARGQVFGGGAASGGRWAALRIGNALQPSRFRSSAKFHTGKASVRLDGFQIPIGFRSRAAPWSFIPAWVFRWLIAQFEPPSPPLVF